MEAGAKETEGGQSYSLGQAWGGSTEQASTKEF